MISDPVDLAEQVADMHPDRDPRIAAARTESDREELLIYGLLIVIGALPVAIALARRAIFGFDATFGLLMVLAGLVGLVVRLRPSRKSDPASAETDSDRTWRSR